MRFHSSYLSRRVRAAFILASLLLAVTAHAEFLRVTAANATGNSLYDVAFSPPGISTLNSDGSSHGSFRSLVLVANQTAGTVDVLVADAVRGQIIRYTPALGQTPASETVVWSSGSGSGPAHPDGLSLDPAGNLYIVTSKLNDSTTNQVWVLPASSGQPSGFAPQPYLIDGTFASANGVKQLQETVIATTTTAAWGVGDLLVLVGNGSSSNSQNNSNDADVFVYSASTISSILGGGPPHTQPDHIIIGPNQFPAGEFPTGMDFYPPDGVVSSNTTLLIATTAGRVLRFDFSAGNGGAVVPKIAQIFATGLGSNLNKLKVALQGGVPSAYVTQGPVGKTSAGQILQLSAPGGNKPIVVSGAGINNPDGLAVSTLNAVVAQSCTTDCDLSGGVAPHIVFPANAQLPGNVIEGSCVVLADPRVHADGSCDNVPLSVSSVCQGFGNEVIPGSMCGHSGVSHSSFALLHTIANGVDGIPGISVYTQEDPDEIVPPAAGSANPPCPSALLAWAPRLEAPSEGTIVEWLPVAQGGTGQPELIDITSYCDFSGGAGRGASIYAVGLTLNLGALPGGSFAGYAQDRYSNLNLAVAKANIIPKSTLQASLAQIGTYLAQGNYACAANAVVASDTLVAGDANPALDYPGDATNPNPWGEVRGRLGNLYLIINYYLLNQPINKQWPPAANTVPACQPPTRVTAANTVGNSVYDVTSFGPPGTTSPLNSDGPSHGSFHALALVPNQATGTVDVLAADATLGQIIRYTPAANGNQPVENVVWSYSSSGSGPAHPDGLSVDSSGNLYIVTSKLNDSTTNAVWVLPASPGSATGYVGQPLLIDGTFATANGVKVLQETVIATTATAAWGAGDLLVLVGNGSSSNSQNNTNDADVLVYKAGSVAKVLGLSGPLSQPDAIILNPKQFPNGEYPVGMDFWPADALVAHPTLLIATTAGRVLRFDFSVSGKTLTPTMQVFASGLGSGLNKLKVTTQQGVPYAYLTQALGTGQILQLGAPAKAGTNNLIGTATSGVNSPDGLAVTH
jgi:hypothetical protein